MKSFRFWYFLLLPLFLISEARGQLLQFIPSFPTDQGGITITLDATQGNQGLLNYPDTTDVYVHTGVITNLSTSSSDWRYVVTTWGTTNPAFRAVYIGHQRYQFTIPNIRSFYGVPAGEQILKIAILFRNGAGNLKAANTDGSDMFIPVYANGGLFTRFTQPVYQPTYTPIPVPIVKGIGDVLPITGLCSQFSHLSLYWNDSLIASASADTLISSLDTIRKAGNQIIRLTASNSGNAVQDSFSFFVNAVASVLPLPSGMHDGVNYLPGDTSVLLNLFAPFKKNVKVIGDFNNWQLSTQYTLNRTPDSSRYWIQINGLIPGKEYGFQYVVDDSLRIADPYSEKILDPVNDPFIDAQTYPHPTPYPTGLTTGLVGVLETGQSPFSWESTGFQRPSPSNLVIYELLVRDFVGAHNYQTLTDTLNYLQKLGVNAIELMPINEFEGNDSWGYNPDFYFAPDKYYGTSTALKTFIDACHQRGIAVILDMVLNHSFGSSPMVQLYFDPLTGRPAANNPWFNQVPTHAYNVGYQFNHESPATRYFVDNVIKFWLTDYHVDGFRFDLAKGFTQKRTCDSTGNNCDVNAWGQYDSSRVNNWTYYYDYLRSVDSTAYPILEYFADNTEETVLANMGFLIWGNMNYNYNQATMGYATGDDLSWGVYQNRGWSRPNLVTYMESHDEERTMYKNLQYGNSSGTYNIKDTLTALAREQEAAAFFFTIPGPKMIWQFEELGYDTSINFNGRTGDKPILWNYFQDSSRRHLYDEYQRLIGLRRKYPFLINTTNFSYNLTGIFKTIELNSDSFDVLVVGNFDVVPTTGNVTFPKSGTWFDYLSSQTLNATGTAQAITLQPGEFHVYTSVNLTNTVTAILEPRVKLALFSLTCYPNPVTQSTTLVYQVPGMGRTSLQVYDLQGRVVANLVDAYLPGGAYQFTWNPTGNSGEIPNGLYVAQLCFGGGCKTAKLSLVR
ncbi:MAG: alpha-amylase family glycosyl hydrolase [Chitinophagaceae bacterium]